MKKSIKLLIIIGSILVLLLIIFLFLNYKKNNNTDNIKDNLNNNLNNNFRTPEEIIKNNFSMDLDLKDLYKKAYIEEETLNLLRTLGTTWYKCPNGHLYVVGECGGPMQNGICPECGSQIGGNNHVPANRNVAVNLNDMRNLNLNDNRNVNSLLNQDQEAQNQMNRQHHGNQEHHMDDDIRELLRQHPEMNNYYNN